MEQKMLKKLFEELNLTAKQQKEFIDDFNNFELSHISNEHIKIKEAEFAYRLVSEPTVKYLIVSGSYRNKKFSIEQVQEVNKENYILYLQTLDQQIPELN
jgi:hypothetical protein